MREKMSGVELRAYVESGKPVSIAPSYGGWSWSIPWDHEEELLKLAELLEEEQQWLKHVGQLGMTTDHLLDTERDEDGNLLICMKLE